MFLRLYESAYQSIHSSVCLSVHVSVCVRFTGFCQSTGKGIKWQL